MLLETLFKVRTVPDVSRSSDGIKAFVKFANC